MAAPKTETITIRGTGNVPADETTLYDVDRKCSPRTKILIDGRFAIRNWTGFSKPFHVTCRRSVHAAHGFDLYDDCVLNLRAGPPLVAAGDPTWSGQTKGENVVFIERTPATNRLAVGDWIYLYSTDALEGVTPHMGSRQCPGEMHQIAGIEPESGQTSRVVLFAPLRDTMRENCRLNIRDTAEWRHLHWDVDLLGIVRSSGRALVATDCPYLSLRCTSTLAGELAINSPNAAIDATFRGQTDPDQHNGLVLGPGASDFSVTVDGFGCRHVVTTSGQPLTVNGETVRGGTPWGRITGSGSGEYQPVFDTHAEGEGIVFDRCNVQCLPRVDHAGGTAIKIRSRHCVVRRCRLTGVRPNQVACIGVTVWAAGASIEDSVIRSCYYAGTSDKYPFRVTNTRTNYCLRDWQQPTPQSS